jgi:hypothetical protein
VTKKFTKIEIIVPQKPTDTLSNHTICLSKNRRVIKKLIDDPQTRITIQTNLVGEKHNA